MIHTALDTEVTYTAIQLEAYFNIKRIKQKLHYIYDAMYTLSFYSSQPTISYDSSDLLWD